MESRDVLFAAFVHGLRANGYEDEVASDIRVSLHAFIAKAVEGRAELNEFGPAFARFLGRVAPGEELQEWFTHCAGKDLWLVFRCLAGNASAQATVEKLVVEVAQQVAAKMSLGDAEQADLQQQLSMDTLPSPSSSMNKYSGRGSLKGWLRTVATNKILNRVKREKRVDPLDDALLDAWSAPGEEPELEFLKEHYSQAFHQAFREALRDLTHKERNLLRFYIVEQIGRKSIAHHYRVNPVTVSRWFAAIRRKLLSGTKRRLLESLEVGSTGLQSILALVFSRLDNSLGMGEFLGSDQQEGDQGDVKSGPTSPQEGQKQSP